MDSSLKVTTICEAGILSHPRGICVDLDGSLYICDFGNDVIQRLSPEGKLSVVAGTLGMSGIEESPSQLYSKLLIDAFTFRSTWSGHQLWLALHH